MLMVAASIGSSKRRTICSGGSVNVAPAAGVVSTSVWAADDQPGRT